MNQARILKIVLLILGLVIIAVTGYAAWEINKLSVEKESKSIEPTEYPSPSDCKVYRNENYGFEMCFPTGWGDLKGDEYLFQTDPLWYEVHFSTNFGALYITINDHENSEFAQEAVKRIIATSELNPRLIKIGGYDGVEFISRDGKRINAWFNVGRELYTIDIIFSDINLRQTPNDEKAKSLFDQVFNSFRFIKTNQPQ